MTRDDIIKLAREADEGFETDTFHEESLVGMDAIERFASLIAAAEREACAKACDDLLANPHTGGGWSDAMIEAAVAIRARGNT